MRKQAAVLLQMEHLGAVSRDKVLSSLVWTFEYTEIKMHISDVCSSARHSLLDRGLQVVTDFDQLKQVFASSQVIFADNVWRVLFCSSCFNITQHPVFEAFDGVGPVETPLSGVLDELPDVFVQLEPSDRSALSLFLDKAEWLAAAQSVDLGSVLPGSLKFLTARGVSLLAESVPQLAAGSPGVQVFEAADVQMRCWLDEFSALVPTPRDKDVSCRWLLTLSPAVGFADKYRNVNDVRALQVADSAVWVQLVDSGWLLMLVPSSVTDLPPDVKVVAPGGLSVAAVVFALGKLGCFDVFFAQEDVRQLAAAFEASLL